MGLIHSLIAIGPPAAVAAWCAWKLLSVPPEPVPPAARREPPRFDFVPAVCVFAGMMLAAIWWEFPRVVASAGWGILPLGVSITLFLWWLCAAMTHAMYRERRDWFVRERKRLGLCTR